MAEDVVLLGATVVFKATVIGLLMFHQVSLLARLLKVTGTNANASILVQRSLLHPKELLPPADHLPLFLYGPLDYLLGIVQ